MRINKFLAECGICSRRKADEYVTSGRVSVNKKVINQVGYDIDVDNDVVFFDGKKILRPTHFVYKLFYKPKGCICSASEEKQLNTSNNEGKRKTIFDYIKSDVRLFSVGRLDYDSEGLLLLTNDGELAHKLTHPGFEISKTYIVRIEGEIQESDLAILRKGVTFENIKYAPCKLKILNVENNQTRLEMKIIEGKNREIRKMFEAVEKSVVFLKRIAIADLKLGGLARGTSRDLTPVEVNYLKNLC